MNKNYNGQQTGRRLIRYGILLFFLGLLSGLIVPMLANPRLGLSSHLEGVMNGTFLVVLGLIWPRLRLSQPILTVTFWLSIYGTYTNWATTLAAAALGAGQSMMPMAAAGYMGTPLQETIIKFGLTSMAIAILVTCVIVLWGLRGNDDPASAIK